jgi:hypothetical protein
MMTDLFNRLDFYISLIGIGLVIFLWARRKWRGVMSRRAPVPAPVPIAREHRSYAVEQAGTRSAEALPDLVEQLGNVTDDTLLDILSHVRTADGEYRYAESRIARFIGGRTEDRIAQVRQARGIPTEYRTPIANRPTKAAFYDDPDLVYQPPN